MEGLQRSLAKPKKRKEPVTSTRSSGSCCLFWFIYISLAGISMSSEKQVIVKSKYGESLRPAGTLSCSRMRELVLSKIQALGFDPKNFGLHSFRAGGATAAANNPCISERHFKRHGRWKSETAKDGYVKDCRLEVSKFS